MKNTNKYLSYTKAWELNNPFFSALRFGSGSFNGLHRESYFLVFRYATQPPVNTTH